MLSIGAIFGGPEETLVRKLIVRLMRLVTADVGPTAGCRAGGLNVVFDVPGSLHHEVGYQGIRDGRFSQKKKLLMIQVSVPVEVASSDDGERITEFLFRSLREANKIAAKYFKKKNIEYSQVKYLGLVDKVKEAFDGNQGSGPARWR